MAQAPKSTFSGLPPFPTNSQTFPASQVHYEQNVYGLPSPVLPIPPPPLPLNQPAQFIPPPPFVPPPQFVSSIPPWSQYTQQHSQYYMIPQNSRQHFTLPSNNDQFNTVKSERYGNMSEDQHWVINWLELIGKSPSTKLIEDKNATDDIKVYEIKEILSAVISVIKELENASATLNVMMKSVTDVEWENKCREIDQKKEELSQLLYALDLDPMKMKEIKNKLKKRKAKRDRLKRQSLKRKAERKTSMENREKLHQQIDSWLEEMKESVERNRREEELKREADSVLWEVTQKKSEAKKQISLLTSLLQLRSAKATALKSSGKYVLESEISTFNTIIEKLKTMWEKQLEGYLLEEQGLRVMLTEDAEKKNSHGVHVKQVLLEWEAAIFGSKCNDRTGEPQDLEEFVEVRRAWDHFVSNDKTVMASTIPVGWVLPTKPSDPSWAKCLKLAK